MVAKKFRGGVGPAGPDGFRPERLGRVSKEKAISPKKFRNGGLYCIGFGVGTVA